MWWKIALLAAATVAAYFATVELMWRLLRKWARRWFDKDLADLVDEVKKEEKKRKEEE